MNFSETAIVDGTLYLLAGFSLMTWSVILFKAGEIIWQRYTLGKILRNVSPKDLLGEIHESPVIQVDDGSSAGRLWSVADQARKARGDAWLAAGQAAAWHELIERGLRQQLQKEKAQLDSGLGWLASIGSTAPFVGLFGTVWGIMHALKDISAQGSASLEVVAGPIGEALIATALGLAVAIPAVIAYNFFLRQNRRLLAAQEHFATDLLRACIEYDLIVSHREAGHVHASA